MAIGVDIDPQWKRDWVFDYCAAKTCGRLRCRGGQKGQSPSGPDTLPGRRGAMPPPPRMVDCRIDDCLGAAGRRSMVTPFRKYASRSHHGKVV